MPKSSSDLRICLVGELTGGVGVYGQNLLRGLSQLGQHPTIVTATPDHAPIGQVVPVRRFSGRGRWLPQAFAFCQAVKKIQHRFDVVHFTDARFSIFLPRSKGVVVGTMNDYFYAVTSWFGGTGTYAIYHDWFLRHIYYNLTRNIEGPCLRRLAQVFCISNEVSRILGGVYAIPEERRPVIPYGIAYGDPTSERFSYPGPMILFAGGNFQRKGLTVLIRASREVLQQFPTARFVVLGHSGDAALMQRLTGQLGVAAAFDFVGQVDYQTLYKYYCSANVYTMPSLIEAFGIPFLEAMHCGVPVVASDVAGPDDYLRDRHNALMARTGDVASLANCLLELLRDERLRNSLTENGKRTAQGFTVDAMAQRTYDSYESAVATSRIHETQ